MKNKSMPTIEKKITVMDLVVDPNKTLARKTLQREIKRIKSDHYFTKNLNGYAV